MIYKIYKIFEESGGWVRLIRGVGRPGVRRGGFAFDASICSNPPCVRSGIACHLKGPTSAHSWVASMELGVIYGIGKSGGLK